MKMRWMPRTLCLAVTLAALPAAGAPPDPAAILAEGRRSQAIAEYETAADRYEAFARLSPAASEAPEALQDATVLRLGLGQADAAIRDAEIFVRTYGAKQPEQTARVSLAIAAHMVDHEDYEAAKKQLGAWLKTYGPRAPLDTRVRAHAWLGRAFAKTGDTKKAATEYEKVRALWKDPATAVHEVMAGGDRRLGAALTAVGEALFFAAEQRRKEADAIRFPAYHGPDDKDAIMKHINTKVVAWVQLKRAAIEAAEKEYTKVPELQPFPPPRWVIASASEVGTMWATFVAEFRASPVPKEWRRHGLIPGTNLTYEELRASYYGQIDSAAEPLRQRAKGAFKVCADDSVKFQYADAYSARCWTWLSKSYRAEYPPVDELLPQWRLGAPPAPPPPLPDPR